MDPLEKTRALHSDDSAVLLPAALLRLRGSADVALTELAEMKEEAAHSQGGVTIQQFFRRRSYKQPIIIVLATNLGSQLSGFNAVIPPFFILNYSLNRTDVFTVCCYSQFPLIHGKLFVSSCRLSTTPPKCFRPNLKRPST